MESTTNLRYLASISATEPSEVELQNFESPTISETSLRDSLLIPFKHFPIQDEAEEGFLGCRLRHRIVRKDLTEWLELHATLVLTTVKEISRLRYELCRCVMRKKIFGGYILPL
ncbi:hypothetical protein M0R45_006918 [Rubus argutus]|uniref:Uncharacterized protein n=1 Tax=Rubus argutus TaxID=59490 RepID=A0AAW1YSB8_RUBAR